MSSVGNVNNINNQVVQTQANNVNNKAAETTNESNNAATEVVEDQFIKSNEEAQKNPTYSKPTIKPDMDKINELKADLKNNMGAFKLMAQKMMEGDNKQNPFFDPTNVDELREWVAGVASGKITYDPSTIEEAKSAVSEDGYWGVEAVSDRIVEFAKAISGGDIDQYDKLMEAIKDGFGKAEDDWGGKMPDITKQTYDKTMEKMEAWKNEATKKTESTNTTTAQDAVKASSGIVES